MNVQELPTDDVGQFSLHDWVNRETQHVDVIASWESLCDTYDTLRFSDPLSDSERLEEYKWIVHHMNSFLSKTRSRLMTCHDKEAMIEVLTIILKPAGKMVLNDRRTLAFQKLRQQWIFAMINKLKLMEERM